MLYSSLMFGKVPPILRSCPFIMKSSSHSITYMPGLDGLRAVAVLSVILYHLSIPLFSGGFLGVDLFFVLSGYLITGLLLREWQTTGRIDLKKFWIHRFHRLFPALFVMLLIVLSYVTLFERELLHTVRQDSALALVYATNWWYIFHDVSYFESFGKPSPIQNLWSLAIEEQFYLIFPALFWLGMKNRRRFLQIIVAAIGTSVIAMAIQYTPGEDPSRVYYGTDTRLFALLIGSLLAFMWQPTRFKMDIPKRGVRLLNQTGAVTVPLLFLLLITTSEFGSFLYQGGFLLVSLLTALLIATIAHPASIWSGWFAHPAMIAIGKRSYGLYLWHFPVITLMTPIEKIGTFSFVRTLLISITLVILTECSYRFIERPIRKYGISGYLKRLSLHPSQLRQFSIIHWTSVTLLSILIVSFIANLSILAGSEAPTLQSSFHKVTVPKENPKPIITPKTSHEKPEQPKLCRPTLAIGDSVLLGVEEYLDSTLRQFTIDAKLGRQMWEAIPLSQQYTAYNQKGRQVIIHLGTNGSFHKEQLNTLLNQFTNSDKVYIVTVRVPRPWEEQVNTMLHEAAKRKHVSLIDWHAITVKNPSYLEEDGVHLNIEGARAYSKLMNEITGC